LEDLGALIKFLRVPQLDSNSSFRHHIVRPIESGDPTGFLNLRLLLGSVSLRRSKDILHLPESELIEYKLDLSPAEDMEYHRIGELSRQVIDDVISGSEPANASRGILEAILQLRILCNHGTFEQLSKQEMAATLHNPDPVPRVNEPRQREIGQRSQGEPPSPTLLSGGHSTKLFKLLQDVHKHRYSDKRYVDVLQRIISRSNNANFSSIIFSSWKKTLNVVATLLTADEIPFVQIDGSFSIPERTRALATFEQNPQVSVLLMTFGTGALGYIRYERINLSAC
jgi:SWI/SNF-related matrix-associated actin-dependent regulator of chromatin subfamily A3